MESRNEDTGKDNGTYNTGCAVRILCIHPCGVLSVPGVEQMTKQKAVLMMLQIVAECQENSQDGKGCRYCAFGSGTRCLVSDGNNIPTDWLINERVYEVVKEHKE